MSRTDAKAQQTKFTSDNLNRRLTKTFPDGSSILWKYDEAGHGAGVGRLTSITDLTAEGKPKGSASFVYDSMGRTTSSTKCRANFCFSTNFGYDGLGRLSKIVYPDLTGNISVNSETVTYEYDATGRLYNITGSVRYVSDITYEPDGQVSRIFLGDRTLSEFGYDPARRWLTGTSVRGLGTTGTVLYSAAYAHNLDGRIKIMTISSPTDGQLNLNFTYDDLGRLLQVGGSQTQAFSYDDIGNMTSNSAVGTYTYPPCPVPPAICTIHPHAVMTAGNSTYTYDADGNLTSGGGRTIAWNSNNLPVSVTTSAGTTAFDYDASGSRVSKLEPGDPSPTYYFSPFVERTPAGGLIYSYYAGSTLVARRSISPVNPVPPIPSSNVLWYHQDHLRSVRVITDSQGKVVQSADYAAFGSTIVPAGDPPDPYGYTGQLRNPSTSVSGADPAGLIYMNARYYDATLARFISPDSIVPNPMNPQSLNRYSYVVNDPLNFTDPSGLTYTQKCSSYLAICGAEARWRDVDIRAGNPNPKRHLWLQVDPGQQVQLLEYSLSVLMQQASEDQKEYDQQKQQQKNGWAALQSWKNAGGDVNDFPAQAVQNLIAAGVVNGTQSGVVNFLVSQGFIDENTALQAMAGAPESTPGPMLAQADESPVEPRDDFPIEPLKDFAERGADKLLGPIKEAYDWMRMGVDALQVGYWLRHITVPPGRRRRNARSR